MILGDSSLQTLRHPVYPSLPRVPALGQQNHPRKSFPCHSYRTSHSPYPATPLFASLTKTAGVYINNSHSGTGCHDPGLTHVVSYSYKLFCTCRRNNSSIFKQLQTLLPKHPGWGYPFHRGCGLLQPAIPCPPFAPFHRSAKLHWNSYDNL
jgi:hypothetical protein